MPGLDPIIGANGASAKEALIGDEVALEELFIEGFDVHNPYINNGQGLI